jgi:hypothetical protein
MILEMTAKCLRSDGFKYAKNWKRCELTRLGTKVASRRGMRRPDDEQCINRRAVRVLVAVARPAARPAVVRTVRLPVHVQDPIPAVVPVDSGRKPSPATLSILATRAALHNGRFTTERARASMRHVTRSRS